MKEEDEHGFSHRHRHAGADQYLYFGGEVGRARGRSGLQAPAVTGDPHFERVFRAHYNTLEQLIVFLPALFAAGHFVHELYAVAAGVRVSDGPHRVLPQPTSPTLPGAGRVC
jgi:hypothetical protein